MYLCVCAIFRALRVLPAMSSTWASSSCPQSKTPCQSPGASSPFLSDPRASGLVSSSLQPCPATGPDLSPVSAYPELGLPHPSWLPCSWLGQQGSPWIPHPTWMYSREPLLGQHPAPGHCQPLSCPAAFCLVGGHHPVLHRQSHLASP